jgi:peptidoglycan/LPS O-acetylase OafA/YrhL
MMTQTQAGERLPEKRDAPADRTQFPCFDGFRAIAAMCVVVFHTGFVTGYTLRNHAFGLPFLLSRLDLGVAIFFLVSAFLLYRPFVRAHLEQRPAPGVRSFFRRRLLRILPAYWAALTVLALVNAAPDVKTASGFPIFYGLAQIYIPDRSLGGIGQTWSLATELSFYAFLPVYAWLLGRRTRPPERQLRVELAGVAVLYTTSVAFRLFTHAHFPDRAEMKFWLLSTTDLFALGITIAILSAWFAHRGHQPRVTAHRAFPAVSWALAALAFWAVSIPLDLGRYPFGPISIGQDLARQTLYGLVAFFLLLPGVFGPQDRGGVRRFLQSRIVQLTGLVSYGIFLWHPWITAQIFGWFDHARVGADGRLRTSGGDVIPVSLVLALTVLLAMAVAGLSYVLVERPFLRLKRRPLIDR